MFTESLDNKKVITPNNRMAEQLGLSISNNLMKETGVSVVFKPDISSLSSFILDTYKRLRHFKKYQSLPPLVDGSYVFTAFIKAINDNHPETILDSADLASEASVTYSNVKMWELENITPENVDHEYFLMWSSFVESKLKELNVNLEWDALDIIIDAITQGDLTFDKPIALFGFDDYSPKIKRLVEAISLVGVDITYPWYERPSEVIVEEVLKSSDEKSHYDDVATLAYNLYLEDPSKKITIVHPQLHEGGVANSLMLALTKAFEPQYILPQTPAYSLPFNISYGDSIADTPLVSVLFKLFDLLSGELKQKEALSLIRSPFIKGSEDEEQKRIKICQSIVLSGRQVFGIDELIEHTSSAILLNNNLRNLKKVLFSAKAGLSLSGWVDFIIKCIDTVGWAQGRKLNSIEYQAYMKFSQTLNKIKTYDLMFGSLNYLSAIKVMMMYMKSVTFKPETDRDTPISVMGMLEAGGMEFDNVILMQMDNVTWPAVAKPSSFLPIDVQIENDLPHNSPERELDFSTKITNRIKSSAKRVIYGFFKTMNGEKNEPSSLVCGEDVHPRYLTPPDIDYYASESRRTPCLEVGDTVMPLTNIKMRGGISVLQDQANCPFMAAIKHRLGIKTYQVPKHGLTHAEQGNIIHSALEIFWSTHKTQEALLQMSDETLAAEVQRSLEDAFMMFDRYLIVGEALISMEVERMKCALLEQMQLEKKRPEFIVESIEESKEIVIEGMTLTYRNDRIDRVDLDGSGDFSQRVALDYKKGAVSLSGMGDKLTSLQLPIQAIYNDESVNGVAYVSLKDGEEKMIGIGEQEYFDGLKLVDDVAYKMKLPSDWDDVLEGWKSDIEGYARSFKAGHIDIAPVNKTTCQTCDLSSVCRKFAR